MITFICDRCGEESPFAPESYRGGEYVYLVPNYWLRVPDHIDVLDNSGDTCAHLCKTCVRATREERGEKP